MDRKQLSNILPWIIGGGFCLVSALKLAFQLQASDERDAASGHVEAIRFAPTISSDFDYITTPQIIALCVVMLAVLALVAWALLLKFQMKFETPPQDGDTPSEPPAPQSAPQPVPSPGRPTLRSFGRRSR